MCGRYDNMIAREAYRTLFRTERLPQSNFPPRSNIAPTDHIPIVRVDPRDGTRELVMAGWGLVPFWMKEKPKKPYINARAETAHKLPMFREAFARRRALIPATVFYEWQQRADGNRSAPSSTIWAMSPTNSIFNPPPVAGLTARRQRGHEEFREPRG